MGESSVSGFNLVLGVFLVDLLLSGDNAVLIALACRNLRADHRIKAMWYGTAAALVFRVLLTSFASLLMGIPGIRLIGGLLLARIAVQLLTDDGAESGSDARSADGRVGPTDGIMPAVKVIVVADLVMSLDNVLALSALTHGDFRMLVFGLLVSIPFLTFGSMFVSTLLDDYPLLVWGGGALLGWVAGDLAIADSLFGSLIAQQSPALLVVVPLLSAVYVVMQSRIIVAARPHLKAMQPATPFFAGLFRQQPQRKPPTRARGTSLEHTRWVAGNTDGNLPGGLATTAAAPLPAPMESLQVPQTVRPDRRTAGLPAAKFFRVGVRAMLVLCVVGGLYVAFDNWWMPKPEGFHNFECALPKATVLYKAGAGKIIVSTATGFGSAKVEGNKILWSNYSATGKALGFPAPTDIVSSTPDQVVLNGGMFVTAVCPRSAQSPS